MNDIKNKLAEPYFIKSVTHFLMIFALVVLIEYPNNQLSTLLIWIVGGIILFWLLLFRVDLKKRLDMKSFKQEKVALGILAAVYSALWLLTHRGVASVEYIQLGIALLAILIAYFVSLKTTVIKHK